MKLPGLSLFGMIVFTSGAFGAEEPNVTRGRTFALANCSSCHAIGRVGKSPLSAAPPFRDLHKRYPIEELEEALAEGIVTSHPSMPQFQLDPGQIRDLLGYLKSIER